MTTLTRQDIESAFRILGEIATEENTRVDIIIVGGAAMVLGFNARESTRDIDYVPLTTTDSQVLRNLIQQATIRIGMAEDWLNDGAKAFMHGAGSTEVVFESIGIRVYRPSSAQLLAMKLAAWRDEVDINDAAILLKSLQLSTMDEVKSAIGPFVVPGYELKVGYAIQDLWDYCC